MKRKRGSGQTGTQAFGELSIYAEEPVYPSVSLRNQQTLFRRSTLSVIGVGNQRTTYVLITRIKLPYLY